VFKHACRLGCEGVASKKLGSRYRAGTSPHWIKVENPKAPAITRRPKNNGREEMAVLDAAANRGGYLRALETDPKTVLRLCPMPCTTVIITTEIEAASRPYSMAVSSELS
jgi:hypothetical protein